MGLKTPDECCQWLTNKDSWYRCWKCVEVIDKDELTSLRSALKENERLREFIDEIMAAIETAANDAVAANDRWILVKEEWTLRHRSGKEG